MLSEQKLEFTKENIDLYLKELAKEYRKQIGKKMPAELILVGGASVLINYGFRNMTADIDALIYAASCMKDAIHSIGDRFGLPSGWLNADFKNTSSYTPKLLQFSTFYKTYSHVLTIRTISAEYLIAMKLQSGRQYKNDLSDILGILAAHQAKAMPITLSQIRHAVANLYEDWLALPEQSRTFIESVMQNAQFQKLYAEISSHEQQARELLIHFHQEYPKAINASNADDILRLLKQRK